MVRVTRVIALVVTATALGCGSSHPAASTDAALDEDGSKKDSPASRRDAGDVASPEAGPTDASHRDVTVRDSGRDAVPDHRSDARSERDADAKDAMADAARETTLALSLPIFPPFSLTTHDYYVRCTGTDNLLTVTMTAAAGATIGLTEPIVTTPASVKTVDVTVAAGGAVVASVVSEAGAEDYWVRCLPPDFPTFALTRHAEAGAAAPGYYLLGNAYPTTGEGGYAMIFNSDGVPVWFTPSPIDAGIGNVDNLLPGVISFVARTDLRDGGGAFELHALEAGTTTYLKVPKYALDYHELVRAPNGNYIMFGNPLLKHVDLTGLANFGSDETVFSCAIEEIDPAGNLRWSWDITDHFNAVDDCTVPETAVLDTGETVVDPFHCNSIDIETGTGNLLVSARAMDSVFLIDKVTRKVLWKMGGATASIDGARYLAIVNDPQSYFHQQHDARFLADGTLSVFDDATGVAGPARSAIYRYDLDAGTATFASQFDGLSPSLGSGSYRQLPDGASIVGWGIQGTPGHTFTEISAAGHDLVDFDFPSGDVSTRAIKIPVTAFDLDVLRHATKAH